ncbi:hypothetical protein ANO11243_024240 [Dothideomycetidae sp. 11243]|nr:hypothetical protein ANO11243_024240 [fungal sp. No.11243]
MSSPKTIRTSVLVISDTHLATPFPDGVPADLPPIDLLLHAGDLTQTGTEEEFSKALDMLHSIPAAVKLVIPGNHDLGLDKIWTGRTLDQLKIWERRNLMFDVWKGELGEEAWQRCEKMWFGAGSRARREGVTMLKEGRWIIPLKNGARVKIYASPFQPEFCDWAFAYLRHQDRFNPPATSLLGSDNIAEYPAYSTEQDASELDVMLTHGPPFGRLDETKGSHEKVGCPHLLNALEHCKPKLHCFGHIHEGWGAERIDWARAKQSMPHLSSSKQDMTSQGLQKAWEAGSSSVESVTPTYATAARQTLLLNASIMDVTYKPVNRPWLVYLDLPAA